MNVRNSCMLLFATLCGLLLSACTSQQLASQSGLYDVPLKHSYKVPVDGYWNWGKGNPYAGQKRGTLYIAPMDVSEVQEDYPELAANIVTQMHGLMTENMERMLREANAANDSEWLLTEDAAKADIRIDLAVVKLRTQKPLLHVTSMFIGHFTPRGVSNAIELISKGNITLEGTIRDARNGQVFFAFKDSNRAKLRFYQKETYLRTGHVDANLRHWAEALATLCRECAVDRTLGRTLRQRLEERSFADAVKSQLL